MSDRKFRYFQHFMYLPCFSPLSSKRTCGSVCPAPPAMNKIVTHNFHIYSLQKVTGTTTHTIYITHMYILCMSSTRLSSHFLLTCSSGNFLTLFVTVLSLPYGYIFVWKWQHNNKQHKKMPRMQLYMKLLLKTCMWMSWSKGCFPTMP